MVSNLLDLSRLEAGLLLIHRAPCFPADLIHEAARRISSAENEIEIDAPADLPLVDVDAPRIEVVLRNLLSNALAYGDGVVRVSAQRDGEWVRVAVADGGPGIDDDDLPYIFERFYRASHGQRRSSSGSGLGLAICKAFVEAHGGRIWAEKHPSGAAISFTLPLAQPGGPSFTVTPDTPSGARVHITS
jgi:signal transduction histidine kinase